MRSCVEPRAGDGVRYGPVDICDRSLGKARACDQGYITTAPGSPTTANCGPKHTLAPIAVHRVAELFASNKSDAP
jgi:hypothetical protein